MNKEDQRNSNKKPVQKKADKCSGSKKRARTETAEIGQNESRPRAVTNSGVMCPPAESGSSPVDGNLRTAEARRVEELAEARGITPKGRSLMAQSKLVRTWIAPDLLSQEPSVQQMAWVQYRYMSPLERTELFTRIYFETYVDLLKKHFPDADASKKKPADIDFVGNESGVMTSLWSARLAADALGMPYDLYLRTVMEEHIVKDHWKRPPRPNQLYGKLDAPRVRGRLTKEELTKRMYGLDWDARFKASEYRADPVQHAGHEMLVTIIKSSDAPVHMLAEYMCERQVLPLAQAEAYFGKQIVAEAKQLSGKAAVDGPSDRKRHVPACLGLPDPSVESPCANCPVMVECLAFTDKVTEDLIVSMGSDNPRAARTTQLATLRKRRQREREKTAVVLENIRSILDPD